MEAHTPAQLNRSSDRLELITKAADRVAVALATLKQAQDDLDMAIRMGQAEVQHQHQSGT